jgi:hypothetical protein
MWGRKYGNLGVLGIARLRCFISLFVYRIPVEARFFAPVQTGAGTHTAPCTVGTGYPTSR